MCLEVDEADMVVDAEFVDVSFQSDSPAEAVVRVEGALVPMVDLSTLVRHLSPGVAA